MTLGTFERQYTYPPGAVLMWSGSPSNLPEGFLLCDGNNGTVDMRNRFVQGASSAGASAGGTGGSNSFSLSTSQNRRHNHSFTTSSDNNHQHQVRRWDDRIRNWDTAESMRDAGSSGSGIYTSMSGNHSHSVSTNSAGGSSSIDNQPPYYTLTFIQKA